MRIPIASAVFGFLAKYNSLRCEIQSQVQSKVSQLILPIFEKHESDEGKIQEYAEQRGVALDTEIKFTKVIEEFSRQ